MSVRPSGADIVTLHAQVRFVPFTIFCTAVYSTLFDRPVDDGTAVLIRVQSPRYRQVRRSTLPRRSSIMDIDRDHIDDTVLALLFLGRHDGMRTWKSFDWAAMERLHTKGLISDPVGKAKSVVFTDEGLRQSEASFRKLVHSRTRSMRRVAPESGLTAAQAPPPATQPLLHRSMQ